MKREYDVKSALDAVSKAGVGVVAPVAGIPGRVEFISGTVSLRTLGAIDYLRGKGFIVKSSQPK